MNTPDGAGEVDSKELIVDSTKPAAAAVELQKHAESPFLDLFILALKRKAPSKFQAVQHELRMQAMAAGTNGFGN